MNFCTFIKLCVKFLVAFEEGLIADDVFYLKPLILVLGVFQSLQQGFPMDRHDIEAAINNICEETNPIEIDTTSFLHASCRHFQKLLREAETTVVVAESAELREDGLKRQTSVRFADEVEG